MNAIMKFCSNRKIEYIPKARATDQPKITQGQKNFLIARSMVLGTVSFDDSFAKLVGLVRNTINYIDSGNPDASNVITLHFSMIDSALNELLRIKYKPKDEIERNIINSSTQFIQLVKSKMKDKTQLNDKIQSIHALILIHPAYFEK